MCSVVRSAAGAPGGAPRASSPRMTCGRQVAGAATGRSGAGADLGRALLQAELEDRAGDGALHAPPLRLGILEKRVCRVPACADAAVRTPPRKPRRAPRLLDARRASTTLAAGPSS